MTAKAGQLWEETATGQQHVVIGADPQSNSVLINGGWRPEDLSSQGYTLVTRSAGYVLGRVATVESRLTAAGIP
jgi:hypothetical protein